MPHTYTNAGHDESRRNCIRTNDECCPLSFCFWKTATFSIKDSAKTLSMSVSLVYRPLTKQR